MKKLRENWFTDGLIDFEYKKYTLLDYLQSVKKYFSQARLYPPMGELVAHLRNIQDYRRKKYDFESMLRKQLIGFRPKEMKIAYKQTEKDETVEEIDAIIDYAEPQIERHLDQGREIYELVSKELRLEPVGVEPVYQNEGYVLLRAGKAGRTRAFRYAISLFAQGNERMAGIQTKYITSFNYGLTQSYEQMKLQLIRQYRELPNPMTYVAYCSLNMPIQETLMPVVKRELLRNVA